MGCCDALLVCCVVNRRRKWALWVLDTRIRLVHRYSIQASLALIRLSIVRLPAPKALEAQATDKDTYQNTYTSMITRRPQPQAGGECRPRRRRRRLLVKASRPHQHQHHQMPASAVVGMMTDAAAAAPGAAPA